MSVRKILDYSENILNLPAMEVGVNENVNIANRLKKKIRV